MNKDNPRNWLTLFFLIYFASVNFGQTKDAILFEKIKEISFNDPLRAEKLVASYTQLATSENRAEIEAKSDYLRGRINYFLSRQLISNNYYKKAIASEFAKTNKEFAGNCYNNMGINYDIQNEYTLAIKAHQNSLKIAESLNDSTSICESLINIALVNSKIGNYIQSKQMLNQSLRYFERINDSLNISICYQNIAFIDMEMKDFQSALKYYNKCLNISRALQNEYEIMFAEYNIGLVYALMRNSEKSNIHLDNSYRLAKKAAQANILSSIYQQKGNLLQEMNRNQEAEAYYNKCLQLSIDNGYVDKEINCYQSLADLYVKTNNYPAYKQTIQKRRTKIEQVSQQTEEARIVELQLLYDFEQKDALIEQQKIQLKSQQKLLLLSGIFAIIITIASLLVFRKNKQKKNYVDALFAQQVNQTMQEETLHAQLETPRISAEKNNALLQQLLEELQKNNPIEVTEDGLCNALNIQPTTLYQLIETNWNTLVNHAVQSHVFIANFFIEDTIRKLIQFGNKINLSDLVSNSPFENQAEFDQKFVEKCGLKLHRFQRLCEDRIVNTRNNWHLKNKNNWLTVCSQFQKNIDLDN